MMTEREKFLKKQQLEAQLRNGPCLGPADSNASAKQTANKKEKMIDEIKGKLKKLNNDRILLRSSRRSSGVMNKKDFFD